MEEADLILSTVVLKQIGLNLSVMQSNMQIIRERQNRWKCNVQRKNGRQEELDKLDRFSIASRTLKHGLRVLEEIQFQTT